MATTVQYNPKTGAKLKKGESVNVNGKTFTQGSSNIYGDTVKTTNANKSTGSDSVKKMQQEINKRGAKVAGFKPLAVDGIVGPNTKREMARFGYGDIGKNVANFASGKVTSKTTSPGGSGSSNFLYTQPRKSSNYTSGVKASSKSNSPFGMLGRFLKKTKDSILSSAKPNPGMAYNPDDPIYGGGHQIPIDERTITDATQAISPFELIQQGGSNLTAGVGDFGNNVIDKLSSTMTYDSSIDVNGIPTNITPVDNSIDLNTIMSSPGLEYDTQTTDEPIVSGGTSGSGDKSLTLDNPEMESLDMTNQTFSTGANPAILNNINMANNNFGVNSSSLNNPWETKTNKSEFQNADMIKYADTTAKGFTSPEEAMKYFNTAQGLASVKPFLDKGGKVEDIMKRIQPVTTGVVGPQTFQEFEQKLKDLDPTNQAMLNEYANSKLTGFNAQGIDTKNVPAELKGIVDAQNKQLVMQSNFLNEQQKMLYEQATQDKLAAQEERNALQQIADARETAIERKTDILTKQYKADMKAEEAETEMNRITARKNLTEFLAQIGALRTDGNAQLGIETLDQRYQAHKSAIRSKYMTLIGNAQAEADEKISDLQYNLKMNTLELYKDLNKTDREIRMETMKMRYDYESDVLSYNTKYQEKLSDLRIKNSKENGDLSRDVLRLQTEILSNDPSIGIALAKQLAGEYLGANPTDRSISTVAGMGNKTKMPETKPKFTGETLAITKKIEKEFIDKGGDNSQLIKVQNLLDEGWSLQQIATNTGMPTDLYNLLSSNLTTVK